jgi:hypothetical protein
LALLEPSLGLLFVTKHYETSLYIHSIRLAAFLTFLVSGALHDIAVSIVKWELIVFFTPWFGLMGIIAVLSKKLAISYRGPWLVRAIINALIICGTFWITHLVETLLA